MWPRAFFSTHYSIPALKSVINALKNFSMATINLSFPNFQVLYFATLTGFSVKLICVVPYILNTRLCSGMETLNVDVYFDFKDCSGRCSRILSTPYDVVACDNWEIHLVMQKGHFCPILLRRISNKWLYVTKMR